MMAVTLNEWQAFCSDLFFSVLFPFWRLWFLSFLTFFLYLSFFVPVLYKQKNSIYSIIHSSLRIFPASSPSSSSSSFFMIHLLLSLPWSSLFLPFFLSSFHLHSLHSPSAHTRQTNNQPAKQTPWTQQSLVSTADDAYVDAYYWLMLLMMIMMMTYHGYGHDMDTMLLIDLMADSLFIAESTILRFSELIYSNWYYILSILSWKILWWDGALLPCVREGIFIVVW